MGRRRAVAIATVAVGAVVLALSLRVEPGSTWFYPATLGLAAVWALGALASGPLPLGRVAVFPVLAAPVLVGLGLAGVFVVGGLMIRQVDPLESQVSRVVDLADQGVVPVLVLVTVVNGVAEEMFFRGAAYDAVPSRPVLWTTLVYAAATAASGNPILAFAALLLGVVVGLERRATGGILAPILTHVTWSVSMLVALPRLFGA